jgi:hypothetical protein
LKAKVCQSKKRGGQTASVLKPASALKRRENSKRGRSEATYVPFLNYFITSPGKKGSTARVSAEKAAEINDVISM